MLGDDHTTGALGVGAVAAADAHRFFAEPAQEFAAVGDLAERLGQRFAHFDGHEQRELLLAFLQQVEGAAQNFTPHPGRRRSPVGLGGVGGVEGCSAVGHTRVGDGLDDAAGGRVSDIEGAAAGGGDPLAVDVELVRDASEQLGFVRWRFGNNRHCISQYFVCPSI